MPLLSAAWDGRSTPRLVIAATSVWNGLAANPHQLWAFRRAELTAFTESPFRAPSGARVTMAQIRALPPRAPVVDRLRTIVKRLVGDLLGPVAADLARARVGVSVALPERMADAVEDRRLRRQRRDVEAELAAAVKAHDLEPVVEVITRGHAGTAFAALQVGHALASGALDVAILGGLDSYYDPAVIESLGEQERLFDGEHVDGFIPGEGGALLLVARHDVARRLRWLALGHLAAAAVNDEPAHGFTDLPCMGLGLSRAAVAATDGLRAARQRLDWWLSDLTPENYRVHELQLAWPRGGAGVMMPDSTLDHLPSHLGDLGAATIATGAVLAVEGMRRRSPAAATCLITGSSLGADRGAVLVTI